MPGDVQFCLRMLAKSPTFAIVSVLTLGLGIGATTAIFSVVDAVVVRQLPYPEPDALVRLYTQFPKQRFDRFWLSSPEYFDLARDATAFARMAAFVPAGAAISTRDRPVRAVATYATASFGATLGVQPALGRWFTADEDRPDLQNVLVISHRLWKTAFAGDPDIVGRHVTIDAVPGQIVGVMPDGFAFPTQDTDVYIPLGLDPTSKRRGSHNLTVIARLANGVGLEQARANLATLMAGYAETFKGQHPLAPPDHPVVVFPLKDEVVGPVKTTLLLLQVAVLLVLLIACANISNLLLARAEARAREIAIRNALGAHRGRLIRQFLTESLVLGALGGLVGIVIAVFGVEITVSLLPPSAPRAAEIHVDLAVLAFAAACALGTSLLFGLAPVAHTRVDRLSDALREGGRSAGSPRQRLRRALVVVEIGLAVVLLIGCGLMTRSFVKLSRVELGFDPSSLVTGQIEIPDKTYPGSAERLGYWLRLEERLRALPGVDGATLMTGLPPVRRINANDMALEGRVQSPQGPQWNVDFWQTVGDDDLRTMRMRMAAGRFFTEADTAEAPLVVVVNEAFARKFYPGEDPIGKRLRLNQGVPGDPPQTIVGVVRDVKQQGVEAPVGTEAYIPLRQAERIAGETPQLMNLVVRGAAGLDVKALAASVRGVVGDVDATIPLYKLRTMDDVLWEAVARPRFVAFLLGVFAALALLLAAVGIYGVMAYTVAQRTRELGIRMALGAQTAGLRRLVLRDGLALAGAGVAVGLAGAYAVNSALARGLAELLYDVATVDAATFAGVGATVLVVSAAACLIPAIRATRVDPMVALRAE